MGDEADYLDDTGEYLAHQDYLYRNRNSSRSNKSMNETYDVTQLNESAYNILKNGAVAYTVSVDEDNNLSCTCPGFKYRGICKHAQMVKDKFHIGDPKVKRIPRAEINKIRKELAPLLSHHSETWEIVGSYRRGKPDSKDIDIIILIPEVDKWDEMCDMVEGLPGWVRTLRGDQIIRGTYKGYPLDINRVQMQSEWTPQLLYRTGSAQHNIKMRAIAKKNGCILNEHGLYKIGMDLMISKPEWSEQDYFIALGLDYLSPEDR